MTSAEVVLLIACVVLIGVGILVIGAVAFVGYGLKKLRPQEETLDRLMTLDTKTANLEQQVVQLRTKKAGRASAARKAERDLVPEGDPRLAGLSPQDRALFTTFGELGDDPEDVQ